MKTVSSQQITDRGGPSLSLRTTPSKTILFSEVLPAEQAKATSLVFISEEKFLKTALENRVQGLILSEKIFQQNADFVKEIPALWTTSQIQWAMSQVLDLFDFRNEWKKAGAHPASVIHPTAQVHPTAQIGPYAVIEAGAKIGADTVIYPHAFIGAGCEIGQRCIIAPYCSIGYDGFGFYSDKQYTHHKIPQIGNVVIEDDCELGAHCAVDRATLTSTRIGQGTKMDNYCHIAHNVEVGQHSIFAAGLLVAGSTKLGKRLTAAGGVHIAGHISVADNVVLTGRAGVANNITEPGFYGGHPLESHRESLRTLVSLPQIKVLRKQVQKIMKHLNLKTDDE